MRNFSKVSNILYRSSAPTVEEIIWLNKKISINRVISLDEVSGKKIDLACKLLNIEHINLPIIIGDTSSLVDFISQIDTLFDSRKKTLIHCLHGKDRTGVAIAIYRCRKDGWSAKAAITEAKKFGFGIGLDPRVVALYESIINDAEKSGDKNDASDIVDGSRESYDDYFGAPSENLSWSPYSDHNVRIFPQTSTSLSDGERNPLGGFGPSIIGDGTTI